MTKKTKKPAKSAPDAKPVAPQMATYKLTIGPEPAPARPVRRETATYKLGSINSELDCSPFRLLSRMPGWHTDAIDDPTGARQELFPEEAIGRDSESGGSIPFPVSFDTDPPYPWLGGGIKAQGSNQDSDLTLLIRELARRCRCYNSHLHVLRQYHYTFKYELPPPASQHNPCGPTDENGVLFPPPDPNNPDFNLIAMKVESRWVCASKHLNALLEPGGAAEFHLGLVAGDLIEVNGYIVSVRVVANADRAGQKIEPHILEPSGSSSHISISSAFSSH